MNPPQTMDGLLSLSPEDAREIDELCYRGDLSQKGVTRHMIRLLSRELEWDGRENSQSLRGVWYSGVKQVYQTLFPEVWNGDDYSNPPSRRFSQVLSETLSEMVKDGEVTYRDLNVVDDSRERDIVTPDSVEYDKIVFVEKRAKYRQLKPLADVLNVHVVVGGGWQATALIEDLRNVLEPDEHYTFFILTDYDPTGYRIGQDFQSRADTLGINVDDVVRLGIEPDQIPSDTLNAEMFEVPVDSEYDEQWLVQHGLEGPDGRRRYGLELEAIGERNSAAEDFRRVVVNALDPHLRADERRERDLTRETANVPYRAAQNVVDAMTDQMRGQLIRYAVDRLKDHSAVQRMYYDEDEDSVYAAVSLSARNQSDDDTIPEPLPWETYTERTIDGDEDPPTPNSTEQTRALVGLLRDEMRDEDGDIDIEDLLDFDFGE